MGLLRLLLALAVVIHHTAPLYGYKMTGGPVAVQAFYMISGFYIGLVLNEKYTTRAAVRVFYENRFLRLFPTYWIVLAISLATSWVFWREKGDPLLLHRWFALAPAMDLKGILFSLFANVAIFTQELFVFLGFDPSQGSYYFTSNFWREPQPVYYMAIVPQAWSLSLELTFYAIAPWLVRNAKVLIGVCVASLSLRFWLEGQGLAHDPWHYRFFPNELFFFCAGSLGYHFYRKHVREADFSTLGYKIALPITLVTTLLFQYVPIFNSAHVPWLYYAIIGVCVPFLFYGTHRSAWDNFLGEMSYPIYISHFLVLTVLQRRSFASKDQYVLETILYTFVATLVLIRLARPFERMRSSKADAVLRTLAKAKTKQAPKRRAKPAPVPVE